MKGEASGGRRGGLEGCRGLNDGAMVGVRLPWHAHVVITA
jgi:hypothetical protein